MSISCHDLFNKMVKLFVYGDVIWDFRVRVRAMVVNATFNNISVILWWSVLLVEEARVPGENQRPVASH